VILLRKTAEAVDFKFQNIKVLGFTGAKRATNFSKIMSGLRPEEFIPLLNSEISLEALVTATFPYLLLRRHSRNQLLVENTAISTSYL